MNSERCVVCGEIIPEGRQICLACESKPKRKHSCKGCTKRYAGCHSTCPDWAEEVAEREKKKQEERNKNLMPMFNPKYIRNWD